MLLGILVLTGFIFISSLCADYIRRRKYRAPKGLKLPPGPPGKPIVGSFFELHKVLAPAFMYKWKINYGDIVSINVFGIPIVFIYSEKIAQELFEKRGALYSDRPSFHMALLLGWDYSFVIMGYGDWWRRHIRVFQQFFNSRAVSLFEPVKLKARRQLLRNLLDKPADYVEHIRFSTGSVIMNVVYAIDIKPENDPYINRIHAALEGASYVILPGLWLIDVFPILRCIPDWFPVPFKKFMKKYKAVTQAAAEIPFNVVKNRESPDHSFVSTSLGRLSRHKDPLPNEEAIIRNAAATAYGAGATTSLTALLQAIVASILHPEAQGKAHEELDRVLGNRLPTLADRKDLPYVNAFFSEVLRWRPAVPLGVPHTVLEDDVYGEYFIPKGSIIIADSWQILRDKKYGPNPEKFDPERFFRPEIHPPTEQFGFGRRVCPGRFFAENTLFLFMASILKVFDITPMKDENRNDIPVSDRIIESSLPTPEPFQCSFNLRSLSKELILDSDDFGLNS